MEVTKVVVTSEAEDWSCAGRRNKLFIASFAIQPDVHGG